MNQKETEDNVEWYTTTFKIPVWLSEKMKDFAKEKEMTGMNMVVVSACVSFIHTHETKEKSNDLVESMYQSGGINEEEKEILWKR